MNQPRKTKVRPGWAIFAPFSAVARDFGDILSRPLALIGGLLGSLFLCAGIAAFFVWRADTALANEDKDLLDIDFVPGEIARLGEKIEEKKIPEKVIVDEQRAVEAEPETKVTKEDKAPPKKKPKPKPKPKEPKKKIKKFSPNTGKKTGKASNKDVVGNNKFGDLPTLDQLPGNPFGSPDGWSQLNKAGDPWATGVMKALNNMRVPTWAAQAVTSQPFRFRIRICKDGRIEQVMKKGGSGDARLDDAVTQELLRLKIPRPPAKVAKVMNRPCMTMKYAFSWSAGRVR